MIPNGSKRNLAPKKHDHCEIPEEIRKMFNGENLHFPTEGTVDVTLKGAQNQIINICIQPQGGKHFAKDVSSETYEAVKRPVTLRFRNSHCIKVKH